MTRAEHPLQSFRYRPWRPLIFASTFWVIYMLGGLASLFVVTEMIFQHDLEHTKRHSLSLLRGILLHLFTGILVFGVVLVLLRKIQHQQIHLETQRLKVLEADNRALASLFAATIAHDINNLLTVAHGNLDFLKDQAKTWENSQDSNSHNPLKDLTTALDQLSRLSQRLLILDRRETPTLKTVDLESVIQDSVELAERHFTVRTCQLTTVLATPVQVCASVSSIQRVLINLILNAAEAVNSQGRIEIRTRSQPSHAVIEVHDNGPGIPKHLRRKVFEPFYTSKENGTGLGLQSVLACVKAHNGTVEITESDLGGACVLVLIPALRQAA